MSITTHYKKKILSISLLTILLLIAGFCLSLKHLVAHDSDDHANLFIEPPGKSGGHLPEHAKANMARLVSVNAQALRSSKLTMRLFNGRAIIAELKRSSSASNNKSLSWIGEVAGYPGSLVVLTERNGVVAGSISFGSELYQINPTSEGSHVFFQVDEESLPAFGRPLDAITNPQETGDSTSTNSIDTSTSSTTESAGFIIDLMVVYTPASRNRYGGPDGIEAQIISAVEAANQAYLNSLINMSLNIVHMAEVNYIESGDMGTTLDVLRGANDGFMDEIHEWRNTYGADMVAMISEDSNYCGIAYIMTSETASFAPYAFSVTLSSCLSNQTLTHELGHNQGNSHDRANSSSAGANPYAYGFRRCVTDGTGFRTIMSYSCSGGTRINYFSNPNVIYNGFATGIDHNVDPDNSADAARSMNNTADTVAAFRASATTNPPAAPANLVATTMDYNSIDLNWQDNSSDEVGFRIERSPDQADWSEIATISANVNSYSDNGLTGSTTYYYRVRAYNGTGNSGYSNNSSATTLNPPPPPTAPFNLTATAASGSRIDLAWADVNDEIGYKINRSEDELNWSVIATVGQNSVTYNDTDNLQISTTYSYRVIAFNDSGDSPASNTANVTTGSTIDYYAEGETKVSGQVSGNYTNTWNNDGSTQTISEIESGGKPGKRYSYLEHKWNFNIGSGFSATFYANTYKSDTSGDNFIFQYSTDGQNFADIVEVTSTDTDNLEVVQLPLTIIGQVDIRVIDSDRTQGNRSLESININQLYIQIENDSNGTVPAAPGTLTAAAVSAGHVSLTWNDNSTDEYGFQIESSIDNGNTWPILDIVDSDLASFEDFKVAPNTTYLYRIRAYNGSGTSDYAMSGPVTTPEGIVLSVTGYKAKGIQHADINWSGTNSAVDIYRDGNIVAGGINNGTYTDNIGSKGSGTYSYQICESIDNCSNVVDVVF